MLDALKPTRRWEDTISKRENFLADKAKGEKLRKVKSISINANLNFFSLEVVIPQI